MEDDKWVISTVCTRSVFELKCTLDGGWEYNKHETLCYTKVWRVQTIKKKLLTSIHLAEKYRSIRMGAAAGR